MNIKNTLFTFFMIFSSCHGSDFSLEVEQPMSTLQASTGRWNNLETLIAGSSIGCTLGFLNFALEDDKTFPIDWILAGLARTISVYMIKSEAESKGENINSNLLDAYAWTSSWITYLMLHDAHKDPTNFKNLLSRRKRTFVNHFEE